MFKAIQIIKSTLPSSLQKFYKEKFNREKGKSSFSNMKVLPEVEHATAVNKNQSDVNESSHSPLHLWSVLLCATFRGLLKAKLNSCVCRPLLVEGQLQERERGAASLQDHSGQA